MKIVPFNSDPAETYDGTLTVRLLDDESGRRDISCSSYPDAIATVKEHQYSTTAVKIIDRDDDIVFDSVEMNIDDWESEWEHAKRRLSTDVEEYDCPYDSVACFADDLCVQCQMDAVQSR